MANTYANEPRMLSAEQGRPPMLLCDAVQPWGGVVLLHEGFGLNPFAWRQAARFAAAGLDAAAPALFWRQDVISLAYDAEAEAAQLARDADPAGLLADIEAARQVLAANAGPVMLVGWCFGGMAACLAGLARAKGFAAIAAWYPVRLRALVEARKDGPLGSPLMILLGTRDRFVAGPEQEWLLAWVERQRDCSLVRYEGADHGFCNPDRVDLHDAEAADASWASVLAHLRRHAGQGIP